MTDERAARDADKWRHLQTHWLHLTGEQRATLIAVAADLGKLGPRACRVLALQAERLAMGAAQYGDFEPKQRNQIRETLLEHIDATSYLAVALLELDDPQAEDTK